GSAALAKAAMNAVGLGDLTDSPASEGAPSKPEPQPSQDETPRAPTATDTPQSGREDSPDPGDVQILMPEAGQYAYGTRDWAETLFKGAKTDPWGHDWRASQRARYVAAMGLVNHQLNGTPVANVLDIGCCLGDFTAELADRFNACEVLGVDISEEAVRKCSGRFESDPRLRFEQAALPELAVSRDGFDFVSALEVIYYVGTPERIEQSLRRIHELMEPGGWLLISSCLNRPPFRTAEPFEEMVSRHFTVVDRTLRYHGLYSSQETLVRQSMQAAKMLAGAVSAAGKAAVDEYLQAGVKLLGNVDLVEDLHDYARRSMGAKGMSHAIVLARKDR
ncbi:MAG: class I SAM-dependent methyltransferase, partial [Phycisphaerae bacterium]